MRLQNLFDPECIANQTFIRSLQEPFNRGDPTIGRYLDEPDLPDVDLFLRTSGEQRFSNFMLWQSAYAEMVFMDTLWPDVDRRTLWEAIEIYARRDRRYGGAVDAAKPAGRAAR